MTALLRSLVCGAAVAALLAAPSRALAWGTAGHHIINLVAVRTLPAGVPPFLADPQLVFEVEAVGAEPDVLKGAGESWDADNDPGHYVDVNDDGTIAGGIALDALPPTMEAYAKALAASGKDPYSVGYLPYSIVDGWEQLRQDFAYWRAFSYLAEHGANGDDRAYFIGQRDLRQDLIARDIGYWGHFVGDASQPLHVSIHYNGWGDYPNPNGYSENKDVHAHFEGAFVRDHVNAGAVVNLIKPSTETAPAQALTQAQISAIVGAYLAATSKTVPQLYEIEKRGGFAGGSSEAVAFTTARVAAGASELRDLIYLAWLDSANVGVGYPRIPVRDILDGKVTPGASAFGGD